jgi:mannose-6-phosphate isomerase-like protein (cupin superfamily)
MSDHLIFRHDSEGPRLNVPNLNEIRVLIDRGETRFTEIGLNTWRTGLTGPPHNHEAKEQIFYITSGTGRIVVGSERFSVEPGDTVYVPPSVVHQTIVGPDGPLTYILFNAFLNDGKEGHASFEEHVKALGQTRLQQAAMGTANVDGSTDFRSSSKTGLHISGKRSMRGLSPRSNETVNLLDNGVTKRSAAQIANLSAAATEEISPDHASEQTLYILSGSAQVQADDLIQVSQGHVVFIPANNEATINAGLSGVKWLWLRTYLNSGM